MTISSSLNAGVAGLNANASRLASISDNIANSKTYGYKRAVTEFHSMVSDSGKSLYSAGGVRSTSQRMIEDRGSLVTTKNATDLAVRGRGMIPVTGVASLKAADGVTDKMMVTTGSFYMNAEGYLTTASGLALMAWKAQPDETIPNSVKHSLDGLSPVQINKRENEGAPTTKVSLSANLPATSTQAGASGDAFFLSSEYYDSLAVPQTLEFEFVPTVPGTGRSNTWNLRVSDLAQGGAVISEHELVFNGVAPNAGQLGSVTTVTGNAYTPADGTIELNVLGSNIMLNIGMLNDDSGLTQATERFTPGETKKDGYSGGDLASLEVDKNGFLSAYYDNGSSRILYQIPLIDVPNANGLETGDAQTYRLTKDSGGFTLWGAGEGPTGEMMSFSREESATDVAGELTELIQTQRAYSSNAKVIQTVDEMLQETTNLKR